MTCLIRLKKWSKICVLIWYNNSFNITREMQMLKKNTSYLYSGVRPQEKDGDMSLWINRCTLKVNWTIQTNPDGCFPSLYSVRLLKNNQEITTSGTTLTSYSFEGTDSESTYRVIVSPILECNNGSRPRGNSLDHSISAIPSISFLSTFWSARIWNREIFNHFNVKNMLF